MFARRKTHITEYVSRDIYISSLLTWSYDIIVTCGVDAIFSSTHERLERDLPNLQHSFC